MTFLAQRRSGQVVSISMSTGGSGYTAPPTVTFSGGGGTGASGIAHMAGTQVESVAIINGGTGYTTAPTVTIGGNAAATAKVYAGPLLPASFVRSRLNDLYVFDGMGRGLRWNGAAGTMQPIGVQKPHKGPAVTIASAAMAGYVDSVSVVSPGSGYSTAPSVTFAGGTPTTPATAKAQIAGGRVVGIDISEPGVGYQAAPTVTLSASNAANASFNVGVVGSISAVTVANGGSGYTSAPTVVFSSSQGLANARATVNVSDTGQVLSVDVLSGGTGATTGVTATLSGGGGSGASLLVGMQYGVNAVTVVSGGTGFLTPPQVSFQPAVADVTSSAAAATATVSGGSVTKITVSGAGQYSAPPTVVLGDYQATATATISNALRGTYKCAIRYIDATPESQSGPISSSISELVEVDATAGASSLTWTLSHAGLDDRVHAVELYRTTADQSVLLFRVAKILRSANNFSGTYTDALDDERLSDAERDGYALLPVTMPSGQLNARRFGVPPGNFAEACMFQDRCWLAVDTTGERPNSLFFSEVDEPESIPSENELVVQENAGDSDAIVALIPLGSFLLAAQSRHLYKLSYVAQPVLDASIMLVAYRGVLNSRCFDVMGGVAYIADSYGLYAFDGQGDQPLSVPVDDYFRDGIIDFSKSSQCFVRADLATKVVRFFYCTASDSTPSRALCYSTTTKAWWEERYAVSLTAAAPYAVGGQQGVAYATASGGFVRMAGFSDSGASIPYSLRTGNMALSNEDGRQAVSVLYTPTAGTASLSLQRFFNGSSTPRSNVIASDRGDGFVSVAPGSESILNMAVNRSPLGDASGLARAAFSGGNDERSIGADRHVAVALSGTQASSASAPAIHAIVIEGAK
jgi:hypothetical protein